MNKIAASNARSHLARVLTIALAVTVFDWPAPSYSQELEEIIVTAQRREQNLQEVGISVTAFTANAIRELGFVNTTDVVTMTPGLSFTVPNAESSVINFFLRGVGLNEFADAQENPVAVYLDDVYKPAMGGLHFQLFDMERVEVLRGPQGALFGRNTTGGVVHYISKRPTSEPEGYLDVMVGDNSQVKAEAAISGGTETVQGRLSLAVNQHDGYVKNRFTPNAVAPGNSRDYSETDSTAGRGQILFNFSDNVELLLSANYSRNEGAVGAWQHQVTRPGGDPTDPTALDTSIALGASEFNEWCEIFEFAQFDPGTDCLGFLGAPGVVLPGGVPEVGIDNDGDPWAGNYDRSGRVETKNVSYAADLNWEIGDLLFTSITSTSNVERLQEEDTEMGPMPIINPTFAAETDTFTQEFRLASTEGSTRWLVGAYYFDNEVTGIYDLDTTQILDLVLFDVDYTQDTESWQAFGQVEFDFSDTWTLVAGVRYTDEEKTMNFENIDLWGTIGFCSTNDMACGVPATPISAWRPTADHTILFSESAVGSLAKHDESYVTGKVELDYNISDDMMIYGSYSLGAKSPGFNSGFIDTTGLLAANIVVPAGDPLCPELPFSNSVACSDLPFKKEELNAFEVGYKSTIFDGSTRLNAAAFYYDYSDMQVFAFQFFNQIIFNADAEMFGAEIELQSSPMEGLDLQFGLSYLDATVEDIPQRSTPGVQDRTPVAAPEWTANALVRYEWPAFGGSWSVMGWAYYQSETYYDILNHPVSREDGYTVVNFRTAFVPANDNLEFYAFVNNAFEEEYIRYSFDFTIPFGFNQRSFGPPRWWGAGFTYSWGD
jgi:iron complex outermembrane receptor protein